MNPGQILLITTEGFEFYKKVIGRVFGPVCLYGQVIKTRRNDRIVKVERRTVIGACSAKTRYGFRTLLIRALGVAAPSLFQYQMASNKR